MTSRWLLNIAAMMMGEYPKGVPSQWRIPVSVFAADDDLGRFKDVAPALGVDVVGLSGGSVVEDMDGDGFMDIMVSSWGERDQIRLFRNNGNGTFSDRTEAAGLLGLVGGLNMVHADYDNDGHPDVLVLRGGWLGGQGRQPNSLLHNLGDGTFEDVTEAAGLLDFHPTQTAAWGDYDNDGWLDLYVGNETAGVEHHPCQLFHNERDGTFTEKTLEAGVAAAGIVKAVAWGDMDNDGLQDLFVSRFLQRNILYHNDGKDRSGRWIFTDITRRAGVEEPVSSMPAWFWDYDNDGWLDLFVSGYGPTGRGGSVADVAADAMGLPTRAARPRLYRNNGDGTFTDRAAAAHVDKVLYAMGANFGDLDNDGFPDFYVGTGEPDLRAWVPNRMFHNHEGRMFRDVTMSAGVGHLLKGHGVAFGDIDNDGDQDIYEVMGGAFPGDVAPNVLFENPGNGHHWVGLILEGKQANRSALGARLRLEVNGPAGRREIYSTVGTGGSFGSSSLRQEMGLGEAMFIRSIEISWPGVPRPQQLPGVSVDRIYRIRQGDRTPEPMKLKSFLLPRPEGVAGGEHDPPA
ncbi:MAG: FG-GAP repeat domain-containing protein [Acidobacteriota bacterium]